MSARNANFRILIHSSLLLALSFQTAQALQLNSDSQLATAGYFQLSWSGEAAQFQLQESTSRDFTSYKVIYKGKDLARVISGKADGEYFYRISDNENTALVSNVIKVTIAHHPLGTAIAFFIAGGIVFIAILFLILKGNKQTRHGQ